MTKVTNRVAVWVQTVATICVCLGASLAGAQSDKGSTQDCPNPLGERQVGVVKSFNEEKRYGYITTSEGKDVFVHYTSILSPTSKVLVAGQTVEFQLCVSAGPKPSVRAVNVELVGVD